MQYSSLILCVVTEILSSQPTVECVSSLMPQRVKITAMFPEALNLLKPNDIYICRTAALTSRRYILNIYSTNIHTEYFKRAA